MGLHGMISSAHGVQRIAPLHRVLAFVSGGCVDYGFVFFEEARGVAFRHVEV